MTDTSRDLYDPDSGGSKDAVTDPVRDWVLAADEGTYDQVMAAIEVLSAEGPSLGRPLVDTVRFSRHRNMKELRPGSAGRSEIRVLFAFDPFRRAVLLVAGDKNGNWRRWYRRAIPMADRMLDDYLRETR